MMKDLVNKKIEELKSIKIEKKLALEKLYQEILKGKEKNVSLLKKLKKEIAQVSTLINRSMN